MKTQLFTKVQTQEVLKDLRKAGYDVKKENDMYKVYLDDELVFQAMIGHRAYLVRYNERLLTEVQA